MVHTSKKYKDSNGNIEKRVLNILFYSILILFLLALKIFLLLFQIKVSCRDMFNHAWL